MRDRPIAIPPHPGVPFGEVPEHYITYLPLLGFRPVKKSQPASHEKDAPSPTQHQHQPGYEALTYHIKTRKPIGYELNTIDKPWPLPRHSGLPLSAYYLIGPSAFPHVNYVDLAQPSDWGGGGGIRKPAR